MDAGLPHGSPRHLLSEADASLGRCVSDLDFQDIFYYVRASDKQEKSWESLPEDIRKTYDRLGIPEAEKKYLAGVKAQYESEVVYGSLQEDLTNKGVIFTDTDSALHDHPELFREYFGTVIPSADNKFAALIPQSGPAGRSSMCRRMCTSSSRCRPISGSIPRTWAVRADTDHR